MTTQTWTPEEMAQHRAEWVDDLRSGRFRQIGGKLKGNLEHHTGLPEDREQVGYCCLGVACETAKRLGLEVTEQFDPDTKEYRFDGESDYWPPHVARFFGLGEKSEVDRLFLSIEDLDIDKVTVVDNPDMVPVPDLSYEPDGHEEEEPDWEKYLSIESLTEANDDGGLTFDQIAALIETPQFHRSALIPAARRES